MDRSAVCPVVRLRYDQDRRRGRHPAQRSIVGADGSEPRATSKSWAAALYLTQSSPLFRSPQLNVTNRVVQMIQYVGPMHISYLARHPSDLSNGGTNGHGDSFILVQCRSCSKPSTEAFRTPRHASFQVASPSNSSRLVPIAPSLPVPL